MDIAHKEFLENMTQQEVINICLEQEETIRLHQDENIRLRESLVNKEFIIATFLKIIKYQNSLNDIEGELNGKEKKSN